MHPEIPCGLLCLLGVLWLAGFFSIICAPLVALLTLTCLRHRCESDVEAGRSPQYVFRLGAIFASFCEVPVCIFAVCVLLVGLGVFGHAALVSAARCCWARMVHRRIPHLGHVFLHMLLSVLVLGSAAVSVIGLRGQHACTLGTCYKSLGPFRSEAMAISGMLFCWVIGIVNIFFSDKVGYLLFFCDVRSACKRQYQVYPVDEQGNFIQGQSDGAGELPV